MTDERPRPTTLEIAWVAGLYEGEGHCGPKIGGKGALRSCIVQKDPWVLEKVQQFYGGGIYKRNQRLNGKWFNCHVLQLSGGPTRALLADILPHLSPRRTSQAQTALSLRPPRPRATAERCVHGHLWSEFEVREPRRGWRFCRACKREAERRRYRADDAKRRDRIQRQETRRRSAPRLMPPPPEQLSSGHCRRGHTFTPANTIWNDRRGRQCRSCWRSYRHKARTRLTIASERGAVRVRTDYPAMVARPLGEPSQKERG